MGAERRPWAWEQNRGKRANSRDNKLNTRTSAFNPVPEGKGTQQSTINPATPPRTRGFHHEKGMKGPSSSIDVAKTKPRQNQASFLEKVTRSPSYMRGSGGGIIRLSLSPAVDDFSWTAASSPVVSMKSPPAPVRTGRPARSGYEGGDGEPGIRRRGGSSRTFGGETPKRGVFLTPPAIQRENGFWNGDAASRRGKNGIDYPDPVPRGGSGGVVAPLTPFSVEKRIRSFEAIEVGAGAGNDVGTPEVKSSAVRAGSVTPGICSPPIPRHRGSRNGRSRMGRGGGISADASASCILSVGARGAGGECQAFGVHGGVGRRLETSGKVSGSGGSGCRHSHPRRQGRLSHRGSGASSSRNGSTSAANRVEGVGGDNSITHRADVGTGETLSPGGRFGGDRSTTHEEAGREWQRQRRDDSSAERFSGSTDVDDREWLAGRDGEARCSGAGGRRGRATRRHRRGTRRSSGGRHEESSIDFNGRMATLVSAARLCLATNASVVATPPHPIPAVTTPVVPRRRHAKATAESPVNVASNSKKVNINSNKSDDFYNNNSNNKSNSGEHNASLWFWSTPPARGKTPGAKWAGASLPSERTRPKTKPWPDFRHDALEQNMMLTPLRKSADQGLPQESAQHALSVALKAVAAATNPEWPSPIDLREEQHRSVKQRYRERLEHFRLIQEAREASSKRGPGMLWLMLKENRAAEKRARRIAKLKEKVLMRMLDTRRRAFLAWARLASSRGKARQHHLMLARTRMASLKRQMFAAWREETRRSKRAREFPLRCLTETNRSALKAWSGSAKRSAAARRMAVGRLQLSQKAYFFAWRGFAKRNARARELALYKCSERVRAKRSGLAGARYFFAKWKAWAGRRAAATRMARRVERKGLRRCFLAMAANQLKLRSHLENRRLDTLRAAFSGWRVGLGRILRARLLLLQEPVPAAGGKGEDGSPRGNFIFGGAGLQLHRKIVVPGSNRSAASCDVEEADAGCVASGDIVAAAGLTSKVELDMDLKAEEGEPCEITTPETFRPAAFFVTSPASWKPR